MNKLSCNVIRDLLPLYVDDAVSADTKEIIEEHLEDCDRCRTILDEMKQELSLPLLNSAQNDELKQLKYFKNKVRNKKILIAMISIVATAIIMFSAFNVLLIRGIPASVSDFEYKTQINELNNDKKEWQITLKNINDRPLGSYQKTYYTYDKSGNKVVAGMDIFICEPLLGKPGQWMPSSYTVGYIAPEKDSVSKDFNCNINIIFNDEVIHFSMKEEGLFT